MDDTSLTLTTTAAAPGSLSPVAALRRFAPREQIRFDVAAPEDRSARFGFRLADLGLLISPRAVCEVVPPTSISRIPNTADWFAGMMNLRGSLIPVFDLKRLFGLAASAGDGAGTAPERQMVLVLERGEKAAGTLIDGFPRSLKGLKPLDEPPPLPDALSGHSPQGFTLENSVWVEFRHESFFEALARRIAA